MSPRVPIAFIKFLAEEIAPLSRLAKIELTPIVRPVTEKNAAAFDITKTGHSFTAIENFIRYTIRDCTQIAVYQPIKTDTAWLGLSYTNKKRQVQQGNRDDYPESLQVLRRTSKRGVAG